MRRFFLSGQTTCALLLRAGVLLRAEPAVKAEEGPPVGIETKTRPSQLLAERAPRIPRAPAAPSVSTPAPSKVEHRITHPRKGFAHRDQRHRARKCGEAVAGRWFRSEEHTPPLQSLAYL